MPWIRSYKQSCFEVRIDFKGSGTREPSAPDAVLGSLVYGSMVLRRLRIRFLIALPRFTAVAQSDMKTHGALMNASENLRKMRSTI